MVLHFGRSTARPSPVVVPLAQALPLDDKCACLVFRLCEENKKLPDVGMEVKAELEDWRRGKLSVAAAV